MGIGQFLLSYWWLVVIFIVIVAVIAKSLIKAIVSLFILTTIFVIFWVFFISPSFSKSTQCFSDSAKSAGVMFQKAQTINLKNERNQFLCLEDKTGFQSLVSCLKLSKQENELSFAIYSSLPKFNEIIDETITSHNNLCPESPLSSPKF